jgi:hypothetical protein
MLEVEDELEEYDGLNGDCHNYIVIMETPLIYRGIGIILES